MRRERSAALAICLASVICGAACSQDKGADGSVRSSAQQPQSPGPPGAPASAAAATAPPSSTTSADPRAIQDAQQLATYTLAEIAALRAGQRLGEWKENHAAGNVEVYGPRLSEQTNEGWCARVRFEMPLDGNRRLRRDAYFYQPDPPAVISLPAGTPGELLDQCRLGFLWAEVEDVDASRSERLADVTRESLASVLGTGQLNAKILWWNSASWRNTAFWRQSGLSLVTATTNSRPWRASGSRTTTRVLVAAAGGTSGISLERYPPRTNTREEMTEAFRVTESRITEAISTAAVGGTEESNLRSAVKLLSDAGAPLEYPKGADRERILDAINDWLVSAPSSPPARRAAALFVADQLLGASGIGWSKDENPPIRQQLEALGARFNWAPLGDTWLYAHSWLRESLEIDRYGRIGDLAFITLMERGFETSGTCRDQPGNGFRAVISEGSDFLSRKPDSPLSSSIHLLMAEAWGDIVRLANGGGYDESDSGAYKSEEAYARGRAIEEYRLAFASPIERPHKGREAWRNAWRLMAGLSPNRTYFYCVYD